MKNKGFLFIFQKAIFENQQHIDFTNCKQLSNAFFYWDNYCKNTQINIDNNNITIYIGDRHFHKNPQINNNVSWKPSTHTGLLIDYNSQNNILTINSDFLGSEIVYYGTANSRLYVTNRIENLTRYGQFDDDWNGIYTYLAGAFTVADRTLLKGVKQTRSLETVTIDCNTLQTNQSICKSWKSDKSVDTKSALNTIDNRLYEVLSDSPNTGLMLSAGWDSRLLLSSNEDRIHTTYTHGDLKSREIKIAFLLGRTLQKEMIFKPLESTPFSTYTAKDMLSKLGFALFPHWYFASNTISHNHTGPLSAGLFVEHLSGHYGINSLSGGIDKVKLLFNSMIRPQTYERLNDLSSVKMLQLLLAKGFKSHPWCWKQELTYEVMQQQFHYDVKECLDSYIDTGTSGLQEISERFKLEHHHRQFFVLQTKSAATSLGYHHPFVDSKLAQEVLKLKYYHRVNYKLSRAIIMKRNPELLKLPMAATLVKATRSIELQELSRIVRIIGEKTYKKISGSDLKGLGWNNFQFLHNKPYFHECADLLVDDMWDKPAIHKEIDKSAQNQSDAYSLLDMFGKMMTLDFKLNPKKYDN